MRISGDLERFKTFIESRGGETGAWRGDVPGPHERGEPGRRGLGGTGVWPSARHRRRLRLDEPVPPRTVGGEYPPEPALPRLAAAPCPAGRRPGEELPPAPGRAAGAASRPA